MSKKTNAVLVEMNEISKSFGGSLALDKVSIQLKSGSVHGLMGENGAGKSTLMKILAGVHQMDSGKIIVNGKRENFKTPRDALNAGISIVFQEFSLLPNLTITENMYLGREPLTYSAAIDYKKMEISTRETLEELGLFLDPNKLVSNLSIAERQFVEIAHGIKANAQVFILDEPTAALNSADINILKSNIRRLKSNGKAIVYISHRIEEIFEICDEVTVLKDGEIVNTESIENLNSNSLINMMVGRELKDLFPSKASESGEPILSLNNFQITPQSKPFTLNIFRGEIVALAGLEGQGQQEILRSLVGLFKIHSGNLSFKNENILLPDSISGIREMAALGIGFIPEDRKEEGLLLGLSIGSNLTIGLHSKRKVFNRALSYVNSIKDTMDKLKIKAKNSNVSVQSLSGGNQQKVLLGRYIVKGLQLLLVEEPTRGVDIGSKSEIYKLLRNFTNGGGSVLVLSRETIELIGLCDRIAVVHGNTVVTEMLASEAKEQDILNAALKSKVT